MSRGAGLGRRLYDVAAVLVTGLGLARKVSSGCYAWIGEAGRAEAAAAAAADGAEQQFPSPAEALLFPELPSLKRGRDDALEGRACAEA